MIRILTLILLAGVASIAAARTPDGKPLAVLIAGKPSHGPGEHEHNAGVLLFAKALAQGAPQLAVKVHLNEEWPTQGEFDQADTILLYSDAGGKVLTTGDRLAQLGKAVKRGAGLVVVHWALDLREMPKEALAWLGGFKDPGWSVNPTWTANYKSLPTHPVTRGVKPFSSKDEWYFHFRYNDKSGTLVPILVDLPTLEDIRTACCGFVLNPAVESEIKAGKAQSTAWAYEREDGGRGFGFGGGHFHKGWGIDDQRKLLLNAILWTARLDVPADGVSSTLTVADLAANLDPKEDEEDD